MFSIYQKNILQTELKQFLCHEGKWRDEYAVSLLKTGFLKKINMS